MKRLERIVFKRVYLWTVLLTFLVVLPAACLWGYSIARFKVFPHEVVEEIVAFLEGDEHEDVTLWQKISSLTGGTERFAVKRGKYEEVNGNIFDQQVDFRTHLKKGYYLLYGAFEWNGKATPVAHLINTQGKTLRSWPFPFVGKSNSVRRAQVSIEGIVVSTSSNQLRALDWCGQSLWVASLGGRELGFHHEIAYGEGTFTVWFNDKIVEVDEKSGAAKEVMAMRDIVLANPEIPLLRATLKNFKYGETNQSLKFDNKEVMQGDKTKSIHLDDNFHQNKVVVNRGKSDAFPDDALLISLRQVDLVAIVSRGSSKVLWHATFDRQHDPDWQTDGVTVYNNRSHFSYSTIEYAGFDGERKILVGPKNYRWYRQATGNHQMYSDGSILFQSKLGEAVHLDKDGKVLTLIGSRLKLRNVYYLEESVVERHESKCK